VLPLTCLRCFCAAQFRAGCADRNRVIDDALVFPCSPILHQLYASMSLLLGLRRQRYSLLIAAAVLVLVMWRRHHVGARHESDSAALKGGRAASSMRIAPAMLLMGLRQSFAAAEAAALPFDKAPPTDPSPFDEIADKALGVVPMLPPAGDSIRSTASGATRSDGAATGIAPMPALLSEACFAANPWRNKHAEHCYFATANATLTELARDPRLPYCYGVSGRPRGAVAEGESDTSPPLLVHTAALTALPPAMSLLLRSFLATQCCDAELWYWLPPTLYDGGVWRDAAAALPAHQRHRVVWHRLDVAAEWSAVAGEFPGVNATTVAAMSDWSDLRYISDWLRLLLMYRYGGLWFDIDTVFLRDLRVLDSVKAPSFAYPAGFSALINNAAMRLAQRPDAYARHIMAHVLERRDPRPDAIGHLVVDARDYRQFAKGPGAAGSRYDDTHSIATGFEHVSLVAFDFFWSRFLRTDTPAMEGVHPEIVRDVSEWADGRAWHGFFQTRFNESTVPTRAELDDAPFLPGSITYHWHNR
jgi:hypothetical protein